MHSLGFRRLNVKEFMLLCNFRPIFVAELLILLMLLGCREQATVSEEIEPWDNFQSSGWHAVDPEEYGDGAFELQHVESDGSSGLQLSFDIGELAFATFRNHDIPQPNWADYRAMLVDIENQTDQTVGLALFLSNDESGAVWRNSMRHQIPPGMTSDLRIGLRPNKPAKGAPKDWKEDAWQFTGLDHENINRIAFRIYAVEGSKGNLLVSKPRFTKLASTP